MTWQSSLPEEASLIYKHKRYLGNGIPLEVHDTSNESHCQLDDIKQQYLLRYDSLSAAKVIPATATATTASPPQPDDLSVFVSEGLVLVLTIGWLVHSAVIEVGV